MLKIDDAIKCLEKQFAPKYSLFLHIREATFLQLQKSAADLGMPKTIKSSVGFVSSVWKTISGTMVVSPCNDSYCPFPGSNHLPEGVLAVSTTPISPVTHLLDLRGRFGVVHSSFATIKTIIGVNPVLRVKRRRQADWDF